MRQKWYLIATKMVPTIDKLSHISITYHVIGVEKRWRRFPPPREQKQTRASERK